MSCAAALQKNRPAPELKFHPPHADIGSEQVHRAIKTHLHNHPESARKIISAAYPLFLLLAMLLLVTGCQTKSFTDPIVGPGHQVNNVFRKEATLPATLRRVAVLPVSYDTTDSTGLSGQEILEPIYHSELAKTALFELVIVKPSQLQEWTGQLRWDSYEELPPRLFETIAQKTGCDGVIFAHLFAFKAYPPMSIGWRMKLVANDADILWAAEEVFDASEATVSNSARRYSRAHVANNPVLEDSRAILISPRQFGKYATGALLETLPAR